jgi:hypothetical protein
VKSCFPIVIFSALVVAFSVSTANAQLDITKFGKNKKGTAPILSPIGPQPSFWDNLNPFRSRSTNVLSFEQPAATVDRLHDNTQRALAHARDAIVKPIRDLQNFKLGPVVAANDRRSIDLIPDWLKSRPVRTQSPTDWIGKAPN